MCSGAASLVGPRCRDYLHGKGSMSMWANVMVSPSIQQMRMTCQSVHEVLNGHIRALEVDLRRVIEQVLAMGRVSIYLTGRCIAGVAGCVICQHEDNVLVIDTKPAGQPLSAAWEVGLSIQHAASTTALAGHQQDTMRCTVTRSVPSAVLVDGQRIGRVAIVEPKP